MSNNYKFYCDIQSQFSDYFSELGFCNTSPFQLDDSDSSQSFVRSINTKPAFEFYKNGRLWFGKGCASLIQPVVRPEDFLPIDYDILTASQSDQAKKQYRCGFFNMMALWQANSLCKSEFDFCQEDLGSFYGMLGNFLRFLTDQMNLEIHRMWFTLWPGGDVADGRHYMPQDEHSLFFLTKVMEFNENQIAWDSTNIWPDVANKRVLDPERSGLMGPRIEIYYNIGNSPTISYPESVDNSHEKGWMELVSAIPITWIHNHETRDFLRIPTDRSVSELAFGMERLIACIEQSPSVHNISYMRELRSILCDQRHANWIPKGQDGDSIFAKICDRVRFVVLAAAQKIDFSSQGKGSTLKRASAELFDIFRCCGLNNYQISGLIIDAIDFLAQSDRVIASSRKSNVGDFVHQQLSPGFVLGKKYIVGEEGEIVDGNVVFATNKSDVRLKRKIPELDRK